MSNNISFWRRMAKLSQKELAAKIGYKTQSAISMWELGLRNPPFEILPLLSRVLNCTIEDLYLPQDVARASGKEDRT